MKKNTRPDYELIPFEKSQFYKGDGIKDQSSLLFYAEMKAAVDNPTMAVEVKWPEGMTWGDISSAILRVKRAFPDCRFRTSSRESLRERGVFQIMYRDKKTDSIDVGEPDKEFEVANPAGLAPSTPDIVLGRFREGGRYEGSLPDRKRSPNL